MSKLLDAMMIVMPLMKEITQTDCHIALCDTEKCIGRWNADSFQIPGGCKPGDSILNDKFINEVKRTRKTAVDKLPAEVFGSPILNVNMPLIEDGEYVGCLIFCSSRIQQEKISESSKKLTADLESTKSLAEASSDRIAQFSNSIETISQASEDLADQAKSVSNLIKTIQSTASQSNILALNASIEAARAGEHGLGFAVVAQKMGQLAKISGSSAKDISANLGSIFGQLAALNSELGGAADGARRQAEDIQTIKDNLVNITDNSNLLLDFAEKC